MKTLKDAFRHTKRETKHSLFKNVPNLHLKGNQFVVPSPQHLQKLITQPISQSPQYSGGPAFPQPQALFSESTRARPMSLTKPKFGHED